MSKYYCFIIILSLLVTFAENPHSSVKDESVCLDCHSDMERTVPSRIHDVSGSLIEEGHQMWSCVDCHDYITNIPHEIEGEPEVDCLMCHDEVPETD
jgi:hypothetical protein